MRRSEEEELLLPFLLFSCRLRLHKRWMPTCPKQLIPPPMILILQHNSTCWNTMMRWKGCSTIQYLKEREQQEQWKEQEQQQQQEK